MKACKQETRNSLKACERDGSTQGVTCEMSSCAALMQSTLESDASQPPRSYPMT